jgi:exopolysaccharide biosynthesis polyprenyl glycosylphosphotransferase
MLARKKQAFRRTVAACDLASLAMCYGIAYWFRAAALTKWYAQMLAFREYLWTLWFIGPIWVFFLYWQGLYDATTYRSSRVLVTSLVKSHSLASLLLLSTMYLLRVSLVSRLFLEIFVAFAFAVLLVEKQLVRLFLLKRAIGRGSHLTQVAVIGDGPPVEKYVRLLRDQPHWGMEVVRVMSLKSKSVEKVGLRNAAVQVELDPLDCLERLFAEHNVVDEVVALIPWLAEGVYDQVARACLERGVVFRSLIKAPELPIGKTQVEDLGDGVFLVSVTSIPEDPVRFVMTRCIDILGALVGLGLCGFAYVLFASKIRKESRGPVLFRQNRVGRNGRCFTMYKFRTMYVDAESLQVDFQNHNEMLGHMFKLRDDPRVTPTGKVMRQHYLDELPQFWNVLKGDMSLVGTRPPTPDEVSKYEARHHRRLSMKAGMTGLWQLNGNDRVKDFEEVVLLDCKYIDSWSPWLDCKIILSTLSKVWKGDGY